jgi:hypothetical protein
MRKFVSALAIAAGLALLATPVHAQPYPPTSGGLTVSESTVSPGDTMVVSGEGAEPGATVTITLSRSSSSLGAGKPVVAAGPALARLVAATRPVAQGGVTLGRTTAAADGSFRITVTIPLSTEPGIYTLTASSGGEVLGVVTLRVVAASTGGLPFTGTDVGPGLVVGAGLIVAGGLLLLAIRRRRRITA